MDNFEPVVFSSSLSEGSLKEDIFGSKTAHPCTHCRGASMMTVRHKSHACGAVPRCQLLSVVIMEGAFLGSKRLLTILHRMIACVVIFFQWNFRNNDVLPFCASKSTAFAQELMLRAIGCQGLHAGHVHRITSPAVSSLSASIVVLQRNFAFGPTQTRFGLGRLSPCIFS